MRTNDWKGDRSAHEETAFVRRMRARRVIRIESGDTIRFDIGAYRMDRSLGIAEHVAVENSLTVVRYWPDILDS